MSDPPSSALRYEPLVKLATGGTATVFIGAARGALGFRQLVAIKRSHPHLVEDAGLRDILVDEARLASRIHHANVVDVRDVEVAGCAVQLVMDYVEGASLGQLIAVGARTGPRIPPGVAVRVVLDACAGLHAAHELTDDAGRPLGVVHRDVSPQNILVGVDGVARIADFGIAKAAFGARPVTTDGALKGKIGYFAPEYVRGQVLDRRADIFALGVVLWEALAHKRLFRGSNDAEALDLVLREPAPPVSAYAPEVGTALDDVIARAVAKDPAARFPSARALAEALEAAAQPAGLVASHDQVARAVQEAVGDELAERRRLVRERLAATESEARIEAPPPSAPMRAPVLEAMPTTRGATAVDVKPPRAPARRGRAIGIAIAVIVLAGGGLALRLALPRSSASPPAMSPASVAPTSLAAPTASIAPAAPTNVPPPAPTASATAPGETPSAVPSASAAPSASAPAKRGGRRPLPTNPYR